MSRFFGFTLTELMITVVIGSILATLGMYGYMDSLRIERRKDAIFSLKKAAIIIMDSVQNGVPTKCVSNNKPYDNTADDCQSDGGFYLINYDPNGFTVSSGITNKLLTGEKVYLKATASSTASQSNDNKNGINCTTIYLTDQNNLHPTECIN